MKHITIESIVTEFEKEFPEVNIAPARTLLASPEAVGEFLRTQITSLIQSLIEKNEGAKILGTHRDSDSFDGGFNTGLDLATKHLKEIIAPNQPTTT